MQAIDLGDEDGFVTVKFGEVEVQLDLFDTNDRIAALFEKHKGRSDAECRVAVAALMAELGLPPVSQRLALRFVNSVTEAVADLKKPPVEPRS